MAVSLGFCFTGGADAPPQVAWEDQHRQLVHEKSSYPPAMARETICWPSAHSKNLIDDPALGLPLQESREGPAESGERIRAMADALCFPSQYPPPRQGVEAPDIC
jgi:hypothetical protein